MVKKDFKTLLADAGEAFHIISDTPRLDAELLLSFLLKKDRSWLLIHANDVADEALCLSYESFIERRKSGEPIAYIIGEREFMGLPFSVMPGVLIPRPDTETLVEAVLSETLPDAPQILDLCTGSGAIAISLAHSLDTAQVLAVDISDTCVKTARENAERNGVSQRVNIIKNDILSERFLTADFSPLCLPVDVFVSNPPYIRTDDLSGLMTDVRDFEPHTALDGGTDGLVFYRRLASLVPFLLKSGGLLAFEVGHDQAEEVAAILKESGACEKIRFACDLAGIKRVVIANRK